MGIGRTERVNLHDFDEYYTIDELDNQLSSADIVVITLPGTKETAGLFSDSHIAIWKM